MEHQKSLDGDVWCFIITCVAHIFIDLKIFLVNSRNVHRQRQLVFSNFFLKTQTQTPALHPIIDSHLRPDGTNFLPKCDFPRHTNTCRRTHTHTNTITYPFWRQPAELNCALIATHCAPNTNPLLPPTLLESQHNSHSPCTQRHKYTRLGAGCRGVSANHDAEQDIFVGRTHPKWPTRHV